MNTNRIILLTGLAAVALPSFAQKNQTPEKRMNILYIMRRRSCRLPVFRYRRIYRAIRICRSSKDRSLQNGAILCTIIIMNIPPNMIAHKMAVIMMAKYNFFIYERLKDVNIRVYFRAKLKKIIFASKL